MPMSSQISELMELILQNAAGQKALSGHRDPNYIVVMREMRRYIIELEDERVKLLNEIDRLNSRPMTADEEQIHGATM